VECREHLVISQLRTERILQKDLSWKNTTRFWRE